ncbi:MAG: CPBP family intramembrane metalloprotease [Tindallia sp. MSAO_Bac2]|nr:MAG: CPBP family intramembrane metalloprotease [Tindallia sp. MSAO_Bac2]
MIQNNKLRVIDVNILFLAGSILFFTLGFYAQTREIFTGLLITQLAVVLLPAVVIMEVKKMDIKATLQLHPLSFKQIILTVLITLFMYPSAVFANLIIMNILSQFGQVNIPQIPAATSFFEYIRLVAIVALVAGVCEEVLFRGVILKGYERLGNFKAVLITSVLFGIFHYNIYNLLGPIVLGLVFGSLVVVTKSLWAGIIGHVVNNFLAISIGYFFFLMEDYIPSDEMEIAEVTIQESLFASLIFFGVLALAGLMISIFLWKRLKTISDLPVEKDLLKNEKDDGNQEALDKKVSIMEYIPLTGAIPLFIYIIVWQITSVLASA